MAQNDTEFLRAFRRDASKSDDLKGYLRFHEIEDALIAFDLIALVSPLLKTKPSFWKWAIIAAHNSLQSAMVCALADTTGASVLTKDSAKALLEYVEDPKGKQAPHVRGIC